MSERVWVFTPECEWRGGSNKSTCDPGVHYLRHAESRH